MKNYLIAFASIVAFVSLASLSLEKQPPFIFNEKTAVSELLQKLGDQALPHQPDFTIEGVSAEAGADIVLRGITQKPFSGGQTKKQSKHFVCTSCHNVEREDPDLSIVDPKARLKYAKENGLPYLQGTSLYGIINRTSFYNGDYFKKYGDLVYPARNNIREAIQLCAVECSQGRALKPWELESILAYMGTIDLKVGDLNFSKQELELINAEVQNNQKDLQTIELIKSKYLSGAPATFVDAPENRADGYSYQGNPANGQLIYELSCLHCHKEERYSFLSLDESDYSLRYLKKNFPKYKDDSPYHVIRYGTKPHAGKKAYMPIYTEEKLSHEMVEDLRAYVEQKSK